MRGVIKPSCHCVVRIVAPVTLLLTSAAAAAQATAPDTGTAQANDIALQTSEEQLRQLKLANDKAEREERDASRKAIADAFPTSTTSGATEVKTGAGQIEANALTAVAINAVADNIAAEARMAAASVAAPAAIHNSRPCPLIEDSESPPAGDADTSPPLLLMGGDEKLTFGHWEQFRFRACSINEEFRRTQKAAVDVLTPGGPEPSRGEVGGFAGVGTAITVASKLLQLVAPDWEVGGINVSASDKALMAAVAREYIKGSPSHPRIYWGSQISKLGGSATVFDALGKLDNLDIASTKLVAQLKPHVAKAQKQVDALAKNKKATDAQKEAAKAELDKWNGPMTALADTKAAYAVLLQQMNGKPGEALLPVNDVINEAAAADLLGTSGVALALDVEGAGGGYYKRKLIWDFLAYTGPPFYVTGGVTVDYFAVRPSDQQVLAAGLFSCTAGYVKLNRVALQANSGRLAAAYDCQPVALRTPAAPAAGTNQQPGARGK